MYYLRTTVQPFFTFACERIAELPAHVVAAFIVESISGPRRTVLVAASLIVWLALGKFASHRIHSFLKRGLRTEKTTARHVGAESEEFNSCFISHSVEDLKFAKRLRADLEGTGVRCFMSTDLKIGDRIRTSIEDSISRCDKLLLILSRHSILSPTVEDEVELAYEIEVRSPRTNLLLPIRLDNAIDKTNVPWAAKLRRSRHVGDFTNWKTRVFYQEAFSQLLHDLNKRTTRSTIDTLATLTELAPDTPKVQETKPNVDRGPEVHRRAGPSTLKRQPLLY
jgi:TIR domain